MNNVPPPNPKKAGKNGYDKAGYSKQVMVNASDLERSMLEVSLQCVRDNPDARRPDGRKSPYMLCAEEALRLRKEVTAKNQQLETLRAINQRAVSAANDAIDKAKNQSQEIDEFARLYTSICKQLAEESGRNVRQAADRGKSRWFRLGRWLGFYR